TCANTGNKIAARMAMMAITTRSSIKVKPARLAAVLISIPSPGAARACSGKFAAFISMLYSVSRAAFPSNQPVGSAGSKRTASESRRQVEMYGDLLPQLQTDGRGRLRHMPGRAQLAGLRVDAEGDDGIRILIGGQQERARGIDGEVARRLP